MQQILLQHGGKANCHDENGRWVGKGNGDLNDEDNNRVSSKKRKNKEIQGTGSENNNSNIKKARAEIERLKAQNETLKKQLEKKSNYSNNEKCLAFARKLYEKAYSALDIMNYIQNNSQIEKKRKYASLIYFDKVRKEFRNEILLISFIINIVFMRPELSLENIQEM